MQLRWHGASSAAGCALPPPACSLGLHGPLVAHSSSSCKQATRGGYARQVLHPATRFRLVHAFRIFALVVSEKRVQVGEPPVPLGHGLVQLGKVDMGFRGIIEVCINRAQAVRTCLAAASAGHAWSTWRARHWQPLSAAPASWGSYGTALRPRPQAAQCQQCLHSCSLRQWSCCGTTLSSMASMHGGPSFQAFDVVPSMGRDPLHCVAHCLWQDFCLQVEIQDACHVC